jgi:hypothetical protein
MAAKVIDFPLNDHIIDIERQYKNYYSNDYYPEEDFFDYDDDYFFDEPEEDLVTCIINGIKRKIVELLTRFCYWLE